MKRLIRAGEVWIWSDALLKLFGVIALVGVMAVAWYVVINTPHMLGL